MKFRCVGVVFRIIDFQLVLIGLEGLLEVSWEIVNAKNEFFRSGLEDTKALCR